MSSGPLVMVAVTCVAFISTNLDNLLALAAFRASAGGPRQPVLGYWASLLAVVAVAAGIGLADGMLPGWPLGWLGLIPVLAGLYQLARLFMGPGSRPRSSPSAVPATTAAAIFLAMSVDSLAVLGPLVADTADRFEVLVLACWIAMGGVWTGLSGWVAATPAVVRRAERHGAWVAPLLMMLVGAYILLDTATDAVP